MGFRHLAPLALAALLSACNDGQGTADTRSGAPCPTNLDEVAAQVFQQSCIDAGCHGSADRAGGLDLGTSALELELFGREAALCGGEVRVVAGDAASSHLIAKLRGTSVCGAQMPVAASLAAETIDCMASWIDGLDVTNTCETCGGAICVDLMTSTGHCGSCESACPDTAACVDGACTCPNDLSVCDSSCVDFASDPTNCGSCGSTCGDLFCLQGDCTADCGTFTECSGACVDLLSDANHCGSCGNVCGPGASCADGQCQCGSTTISFASDVQPIFSASCASMGCHDGVGGPGRPGGQGGGATSLDLTMGSAYQSLLETTTPCGPVVAPSDAEASILVGKLTGTNLCTGSQMPKGDPALAPELIDTVAIWICQGAENN
jgi:hypothetical protein